MCTTMQICQTINNVRQSHQPWKFKFWQHTTLWMTPHHHKDGVDSKNSPISRLYYSTSMQSRPSVKYSFLIITSHNLWCSAFQLPCPRVCLISHVNHAPWWALNQVNFDPIQDKVAVGTLLKVSTPLWDYSKGHVRKGVECNGTMVRIGHRKRFRNMST